ncbi:MAG: hypothetical protein HZA54_20800 [Planctomycetes bacterium]|nr:hypothetical protein [Planctomycetota bacterium]
MARDVMLPIPVHRQGYNAGCGLGAIAMALDHAGVRVTVRELEKHPLVLRQMLEGWGIGPGRLGRIALSFGVPVTIVDPEARDVGKRFVEAGGRWERREPTKAEIVAWLGRGIGPVVCLPDRHVAFAESRPGSHWVIARGVEAGEIVIHDPAPWRKATRCVPGYWDGWRCSLIAIGDAGAGPGVARRA